MKSRLRFATTLALAIASLAAATAEAGLFRAYLSRDGNDANDCTLAAPCRLLPAALAAINDGGEIWMLDSANYNTTTVTVDKSATILAVPGALGSVVGNNADAMVINGVGIRVSLANLRVLNLGGAINGLRVDVAQRVHVERSEFYGFQLAGIRVNADASVVIEDSTSRNNNYGLEIRGGADVTAHRSSFSQNGSVGITVFCDISGKTATVSVRRSLMNSNQNGLIAFAGQGSSRVYVKDSDASMNTSTGFSTSSNVQSPPGTSKLVVSGSTANRNDSYGFTNFSSQILSDGTNQALDNGVAPHNSPLGTAGTL